MVLIIFSLAVLTAALWLTGLPWLVLLARATGTHRSQIDLFAPIWLGIAIVTIITAIFSIWFPIRDSVSSIWWVGITPGVLMLAFHTRSIAIQLKDSIGISVVFAGIAAAIGVMGNTYLAAQNVQAYDTYLYHLGAVKWIREFPVVPGLANLHIRFGFNSIFHVYAALIESRYFWNFWDDMPSHMAVSSIVSLCIAHWLWVIARGVGARARISWAFCLVTAPILFKMTYQDSLISSLSPDPVVGCFLLVAFYYLVRSVETGARPSLFFVGMAVVAVTLAVTTKISAAIAAAVIWLAPLARAFAHHEGIRIWLREHRLTIFATFAVPTVIVAFWVTRSIFTSGWPLFPIEILPLNFEWTVPRSRLQSVVMDIRGFYLGASPADLLRNGTWFYLKDIIAGLVIQSQGLCVIASVVLGLFRLVLSRRGCKHLQFDHLEVLGLAAALGSLAFWLLTSPAIRFGEHFCWILLGLVASKPLAHMTPSLFGRALALGLPVGIGLVFFLTAHAPHRRSVKELGRFDMERPEVRPVAKVDTIDRNGQKAEYYAPLDHDDRCGPAPLPCTYSQPEEFRFRDANNLGAGFTPGPFWLAQ